MCLGLPVGNHVMFHAKVDGEDILRKYTPISDVKDQTFVDFVIKVYRKNVHPKFPEGGLMTQYLENLVIGESLCMSGPHGRLTYEGFGRFYTKAKTSVKKKIGHIAGGTGITPIFQVLQAALKNEDGTSHSLLFGNRSVDDILLKGELEQLAETHNEQFNMHLTVDMKPPKGAKWTQGVGFVTKEMLKEWMPAPSVETMILYCGPPVFTDLMTKLLKDLDYDDSMLFKF